MSSNIKFTDNSDKVLAALSRQKRAALEEVGLTAERHAKEILTYTVYTVDKEEEKGRSYVLTGRLRNSITFALTGGQAQVLLHLELSVRQGTQARNCCQSEIDSTDCAEV